jgi:hypothetical protein
MISGIKLYFQCDRGRKRTICRGRIFSESAGTNGETRAESDGGNTSQSFKKILGRLYLEAYGAVVVAAVMVQVGKDENICKNGNENQTRR